ncbi:hypothetical protein ACQU0X_27160 [Pseudovibrio ascidiaceicola]|uniref:hypothetical protein n=1 Tax=Pseudovibrio ascidiaceicola TaxID=285279 RepID=UPI003D35F0FA
MAQRQTTKRFSNKQRSQKFQQGYLVLEVEGFSIYDAQNDTFDKDHIIGYVKASSGLDTTFDPQQPVKIYRQSIDKNASWYRPATICDLAHGTQSLKPHGAGGILHASYPSLNSDGSIMVGKLDTLKATSSDTLRAVQHSQFDGSLLWANVGPLLKAPSGEYCQYINTVFTSEARKLSSAEEFYGWAMTFLQGSRFNTSHLSPERRTHFENNDHGSGTNGFLVRATDERTGRSHTCFGGRRLLNEAGDGLLSSAQSIERWLEGDGKALAHILTSDEQLGAAGIHAQTIEIIPSEAYQASPAFVRESLNDYKQAAAYLYDPGRSKKHNRTFDYLVPKLDVNGEVRLSNGEFTAKSPGFKQVALGLHRTDPTPATPFRVNKIRQLNSGEVRSVDALPSPHVGESFTKQRTRQCTQARCAFAAYRKQMRQIEHTKAYNEPYMNH